MIGPPRGSTPTNDRWSVVNRTGAVRFLSSAAPYRRFGWKVDLIGVIVDLFRARATVRLAWTSRARSARALYTSGEAGEDGPVRL